MKVYVVLKNYSNSNRGNFLGITDNKQNAENIRKAYAVAVGMPDPENNIFILEYELKGE